MRQSVVRFLRHAAEPELRRGIVTFRQVKRRWKRLDHKCRGRVRNEFAWLHTLTEHGFIPEVQVDSSTARTILDTFEKNYPQVKVWREHIKGKVLYGR